MIPDVAYKIERHGFAGYALLFVATPALLAFGSPRPRHNLSGWIVGAMMAALAVKMLWCGSVLLAVAGFALTFAFAAALAGLYPYVLEVGVFASQMIQAGYEGLIHHYRCLSKFSPAIGCARWLSIALPLAAFVAFGLLFILANSDLLTIYIGFNGMTRMRMVAIFGMTAVVVGFVLVVWKIAHDRDFVWLMRRHMWTLALTVYQIADNIVLEMLRQSSANWAEYAADPDRQDATLHRFHDYAYQWY